MSPSPGRPQAAEITEEIISRIKPQFDELKDALSDLIERIRTLEMREAGCSPLMNARVGQAETKLVDHEARIKSLEASIANKAEKETVDKELKAEKEAVDKELKLINQTLVELRQTNKILTWIGALLTSTVVIWLAGQLLSGI